MLTEPQLLGTMAVTRKKARQQTFIASIYAVVATIELRPSVTKSNDERKHNISDNMISNKICMRYHELGRCTCLCNQDSAHVTSKKKQRINNLMAGKASRSPSYHEKTKCRSVGFRYSTPRLWRYNTFRL